MSYPKPEGDVPRYWEPCPKCGAPPNVAHAAACPWYLWATTHAKSQRVKDGARDA